MANPAKANNNFNIIRLMLACAVLLSHAFELIDGGRERELLTQWFHSISFGELAVDCFFILSGYLVTKSLLQSADFANYLVKRVLRIFPSFVVCAFICAFICAFFIGPVFGQNPDYFYEFRSVAFVRDLFRLTLTVGAPVWQSSYYTALNGSIWTIPWEFACYLMIAFLGALGLVRSNRLLIVAAAGAAIVMALVIHFGLEEFAADHYRMAQILDAMSRFGFMFLCGALYLRLERFAPRSPLALASAFLWVLLALNLGKWAELALAVPLTVLLMGIGKTHFRYTRRLASLPDMSYGTYLYGWPIQMILVENIKIDSPWLVIAISIPASILCGLLNHYAVERFFDNKRLKSISFDNIRALTMSRVYRA